MQKAQWIRRRAHQRPRWSARTFCLQSASEQVSRCGEAGATRASDQDSTYKATGSYETSGRTPLVVPPREAENPELGRPSGRPAHRGSPQPRAVDTPAFPRSWLDVSLEEHGPAPSRLRPAGHATVTRIWREICRARLARGVPGPASRALTCVRG